MSEASSIYAERFYETQPERGAAAVTIVSILSGRAGYLYSMYPSFADRSRRALYPWPHAADSLIPRITGAIGDDDLLRVFKGCADLVLFQGELAGYPRALDYVQREFRVVYEDAYYVVWQRTGPA